MHTNVEYSKLMAHMVANTCLKVIHIV